MPVPSQDHCGYQLSGGVIPILQYVLWTLICSVVVLYTLFIEIRLSKVNVILLRDSSHSESDKQPMLVWSMIIHFYSYILWLRMLLHLKIPRTSMFFMSQFVYFPNEHSLFYRKPEIWIKLAKHVDVRSH